jgi:hypothetical protein
MNVPERVASPEEPVRRGSVALGFGLAWLTMIVGYVLLVGVASFGRGQTSFLSTFSMPWVVSILLMIWLIATRRTRTALGVAIGLGTMLVVGAVLFMLIVQGLSNNFR